MSRRGRRKACLAVRLKYPEPGTAKTRLGSSIGMKPACDIACAMFADLIERFQSHSDIPVIVTGSQHATIDDYRLLLRSQNVQLAGVEFMIADAPDRPTRVRRVWELLLPRFERVLQCTLDVPYYAPRQYYELIDQLSRYDVVFHPTIDDGMCPYGARTLVDLWGKVDSHEPGALRRIVNRLRRQKLTWWCADPMFDIDTIDDLAALYRWIRSRSVYQERFCPRTFKLCQKIF